MVVVDLCCVLCLSVTLTLSQTSPGFYVSAIQAF